jgi:hypothetical protein
VRVGQLKVVGSNSMEVAFLAWYPYSNNFDCGYIHM